MDADNLELFPAPTESLPAHTYPLPSNVPITRCKSCGQPIVWARTPRGANVPLSLITITQVGTEWVAQSHFTDCKQASGWGKHGRHH